MRLAFAGFRQRVPWGFPAPDLALSGLLCLVAVASVLTGNPDEGPLPITLPVAVVTTVALIWRRRSPPVMIGLIVVAGMAQSMEARPPGSLWSLLVYAIAMYSAAAWSSEAVAAITGAVFVAALLIEERLDNGVDYVFILLLFGGVWLLGRAGRSWRGRLSTAERRQQEVARLAVAEERLRIARDLHDVVAHSLGAIAVQADAAEAALHLAPERAVEPMRVIRRTAREALGDIRRVLEVLRSDEDAPVPGAPGAAEITGLVASARASGLRVSLEPELADLALPPAVGAVAYRIVQESLTNVRRHAPGAGAVVSVVRAGNELQIQVVNEAAPGPATGVPVGSGLGIRGMQERVRALGGAFASGPTSDGGFAVRATIPLGEEGPA